MAAYPNQIKLPKGASGELGTGTTGAYPTEFRLDKGGVEQNESAGGTTNTGRLVNGGLVNAGLVNRGLT